MLSESCALHIIMTNITFLLVVGAISRLQTFLEVRFVLIINGIIRFLSHLLDQVSSCQYFNFQKPGEETKICILVETK